MTSTQDLTDRPAAHVATGVIAVMEHLIGHGLSAPIDIVPNTRFIRIFVPSSTYGVWRDSIVVDAEAMTPPKSGVVPLGVQWTAAGRLPDSGVRVEISGYMPVEWSEVA